MINTLDHLIVAVADLDKAEKNYSTVFGADPVWRGEHKEYGTENSLFNFNNTYFELLAAKGDGLGAMLVNHALQETGEGLIGIVFGADNLKETHQKLSDKGFLIGDVSNGEGFKL
jgi:catechol 2,3-dioxygenase-like lactoylglutathione lyase family enzyme